jgi:cytochrome c peroxidase
MRLKPAAILLLVATILAVGAVLANPFAAKRIDGWTNDELEVLSSMRLGELPPVPADPSNAVEAAPAAASLGQRIFADARFSRDGSVSCASCHQPDKQFQDGRPLGQGVGTGLRRTMPLAGAAYAPFLFWDGRKDSLWSQALGPMEDPAEHGGNRTAYARLIGEHYQRDYEALFGPLPNLKKLPKDAGPLGTPEQRAAWTKMDDEERREVSRIFANMGKALAAYEKTLKPESSRVDRYVDGVLRQEQQARQILSEPEKNGLRLFIGKAQCVTCHNGPLLTDQQFHNTGVPPRLQGKPDPGRGAALGKLLRDEFNCLGPYSDARPEQCEELRFLSSDDHTLDGAFKVPSLRNVAARAPYMHAGQLGSLEEVVRHYSKAPQSAAGHSELKPIRLTDGEVRDLVAFLGALSSETVETTR